MSCDEPEYYCYECDEFFDELDGDCCPKCGSRWQWRRTADVERDLQITADDDYKMECWDERKRGKNED